ncbi:TPA: hypothetical protein N0F65_007380 [Lagenidium giganteum]|uniref:Pyrroline-5-carboxylate reductase catalytic N-terminal domain-containing protein n=1 Tax=Lagenidium giganteum TaxID=4803 RepID=A0AAV2YC40_9STRA|nr:TPA: hypothetical protein N0F65_007380 [Lagenidium giganteum]
MCAATVAPRDKEPLRARAELYAPTRLSTKVQRLFFTRTLVTDIIAQQCTLLVYAAARTSMPLRENALPRVGILGGGHIGCAVAVKLLKSDFPASNIAISTRQPDRVLKCDALQSPQHLALFQAVPRYYDNVRLCKESDVLVLCMPPSQLKSVSIQIKHALALPDCATLVISTLCGATLESLQKACGTRLLVKTRVNVPRLVGLLDMSHGAIGIAAEELGESRF